MFKGIGNLGAILQQAQEMGQRMQEMESELKAKRFTGGAGGGMVEVEINGAGDVLRLKIDPQLVERQEREMIEDLVPAAVNQAMQKMRDARAEAAQGMIPGGDMAGVQEMLSRILQSD